MMLPNLTGSWPRERRRKEKWGHGIPYSSIVTNTFLESYPETARRCIICDNSNSIGQSIIGAGCEIHSFHQSCEMKEGICPKCQGITLRDGKVCKRSLGKARSMSSHHDALLMRRRSVIMRCSIHRIRQGNETSCAF